jgi:predicted Zn-ribbon and HTH transcriptional regulator
MVYICNDCGYAWKVDAYEDECPCCKSYNTEEGDAALYEEFMISIEEGDEEVYDDDDI